MRLKNLFNSQTKFSEMIGRDEEKLNPEEMTKILSLALHAEVSDLISTTNYKSHKTKVDNVDIDKILFESVDIVRYTIAIMNEWKISPDQFFSAWQLKDKYLNMSYECENNRWNGSDKVAIVDIDDVLGEFRLAFSKWLLTSKSISADVESSEYYFIDALEKSGENPEKVFEDFIKDDGFLLLDIEKGANEFLQSLKDRGYYIHLLTARPSDNLRCFYNTFTWLDKFDVTFDRLSFSSEKLRWCMKSEYWESGSIEFAIDDSPKHVAEYAKHGINVLVPKKPYNTEVHDMDNVTLYEKFEEIKIN
jgi:phosphoglycolate phosphatase-like HAD superfamily hydrolase